MRKAMFENKNEYKSFYEKHTDIPIFSSPWWLDVTAGIKNWDVVIIKNNNNQIIATFPFYYIKGKRGFSTITQPMLTQKLGPYLVYEKNMTSNQSRVAYENDIYTKIIEQLPSFTNFFITCDQKVRNWLAFSWNGFIQTTNYSYRIYNIKDHDKVFTEFTGKKRTSIKKAIKNELKIKYDLSPELFYDYFQECVAERNEKVLYSKDYFTNIVRASYEHNQGKILYCVDVNNNIQAECFIIWDNECAYYLIAMRKELYKNSGGTEFLVFEAIKYASQFVDIFDFEGSMMKGIEEAYRTYGSEQTQTFSISKTVYTKQQSFILFLSKIYHKLLRK